MSDDTHAALVKAMEWALAIHFSQNKQPCMSGDPRDRLSPLQRRNMGDAIQAALSALRTARPDIAALLDNKAVAVPKEATDAMNDAGWIDKEDVDPRDIYRAMLAASPWVARDE